MALVERIFIPVKPDAAGEIVAADRLYEGTACVFHNAYKSSIKIDELASHAGISRAECFRCFKRYTGKTPIEYLNDYRLSQAANMLITTELSAVEIGLDCGFESQSYFGKLFKENYGATPLRFRKNAVL